MKLKKIIVNPWGFTLYKRDDNSYILKVMFSEGDYKVDVARYFIIKADEIGHTEDLDNVKKLSERIRNDYESNKDREISKEKFNIMT
ncbi:hypothetical protein PMPD1_0748 [Paramixta manurensis]|uniref:Uncharacterized protein n=1 Tax=Paramixta manurensis TaxID=2740817 RepID=A0A6M8UDJ3_9GAMM|nr:hypothetical protein PMPD1_0748 [Erwiniaceae bacterium PD-1]